MNVVFFVLTSFFLNACSFPLDCHVSFHRPAGLYVLLCCSPLVVRETAATLTVLPSTRCVCVCVCVMCVCFVRSRHDCVIMVIILNSPPALSCRGCCYQRAPDRVSGNHPQQGPGASQVQESPALQRQECGAV